MTQSLTGPTAITINAAWEAIGEDEKRNVLCAAIQIDGYRMHLTALRIRKGAELQTAYECDEDLDRLSAISYSAFDTLEIDGEEYVLYATGYDA